jgi:hypothetical protein
MVPHNMSSVSVLNPYTSLATIFPTYDTFNVDTFNIIAANAFIAPKDDFGYSTTLTVGSSSNIVIESVGDTQMFLKDSSAFTMFQTSFDDQGTRTDVPLIEMRSNVLPDVGLSATIINTGSTGDKALWVYGSDACKTTWVSTAQVRNLNRYTQFATTQSNGFLINNTTTFSSNTLFTQDVRMQSTVEVDGNMTLFGNFYSQNVNLWRDSTDSNQRVGFGFQINSNNQLELIKYALFGETGSTWTKKVAVFGNSPMVENEKTDGSSYLVFDELLGGIGVSASSASNSVGPLTSSTVNSWIFTAAGNVSTTSSVGIGMGEPQFPLDVAGTINADNIQAVTLTAQNLVTTSDERLKNIRSTVDPSECLAKISSLGVIDYAYISQPGVFKTGLRAQQVKETMPDAVVTKTFANLDDCLLVDTSVMIGYLVGAVKELSAQLNSLKVTGNLT